MISVGMLAKIRRMHFRDGMSLREVAQAWYCRPDLLPPDAEMAALVDRIRAPHLPACLRLGTLGECRSAHIAPKPMAA